MPSLCAPQQIIAHYDGDEFTPGQRRLDRRARPRRRHGGRRRRHGPGVPPDPGRAERGDPWTTTSASCCSASAAARSSPSLGLGLVLTQRASGVLNLAHAAMGMFGAATFFQLRETGELVLPVPGLPDRVRLAAEGMRPTFATALVVALVLAAVVGALVDVAGVRPAAPGARPRPGRGLPRAACCSSWRWRRPGSSRAPAVAVDRLGAAHRHRRRAGDRRSHATGCCWPASRSWRRARLALRVPVHPLRAGHAAAAESEKGALLTGLWPDCVERRQLGHRLDARPLATILIAPITGLAPTTSALLIVPAARRRAARPAGVVRAHGRGRAGDRHGAVGHAARHHQRTRGSPTGCPTAGSSSRAVRRHPAVRGGGRATRCPPAASGSSAGCRRRRCPATPWRGPSGSVAWRSSGC